MVSYDGVELCELIGIYIDSLLENFLEKDELSLYRDDGFIIVRNINNQETDKRRKKIISIFKIIDFNIEITTNLAEDNFLDVTFSLEQNTYRPYKKLNDNLRYINPWSNHPPQIIKHLNPEILQLLKYLNNYNQIMKNHWKNDVTKQNCN